MATSEVVIGCEGSCSEKKVSNGGVQQQSKRVPIQRRGGAYEEAGLAARSFSMSAATGETGSACAFERDRRWGPTRLGLGDGAVAVNDLTVLVDEELLLRATRSISDLFLRRDGEESVQSST